MPRARLVDVLALDGDSENVIYVPARKKKRTYFRTWPSLCPYFTAYFAVPPLKHEAQHSFQMASAGGSELSPALLKVATHVYRFPLPATKVIAFTKCFADNLGAEETSKSIRSAVLPTFTFHHYRVVEVFRRRSLYSPAACPRFSCVRPVACPERGVHTPIHGRAGTH